MKKYIILLLGALVVVVVGIVVFKWITTEDTPSITYTIAKTVTYTCDNNRTIFGAYYNGPEATPVPAGQPPHPTGKVELSFDGGATTTLLQTISGSGVRYATKDESLIFWNKGNEALVMREDIMDLTYKNCNAQ